MAGIWRWLPGRAVWEERQHVSSLSQADDNRLTANRHQQLCRQHPWPTILFVIVWLMVCTCSKKWRIATQHTTGLDDEQQHLYMARSDTNAPGCQNFCSESSDAGVATSTTASLRTSTAAKPCCSTARLIVLPSADKPGRWHGTAAWCPPGSSTAMPAVGCTGSCVDRSSVPDASCHRHARPLTSNVSTVSCCPDAPAAMSTQVPE
jgi:hypothetical protein